MSSLRRLNPVSIPFALIGICVATVITAGLIALTREFADARTRSQIPMDLVPTGWKITRKDPWFVAHPNDWLVEGDGNAVHFNRPSDDTPIMQVENQTAIRVERLTALDASSFTKKDAYYFAGHPAVRYVYPDKRIHVIAYQASLYEITVFERSREMDIALATFAFLQ